MSVPNDELEKILNNLNDKNKIVAKSFLTWLLEKQIDDDDNYLTADDIQAIEQGQNDYVNGKTKSMEDLRRELGIQSSVFECCRKVTRKDGKRYYTKNIQFVGTIEDGSVRTPTYKENEGNRRKHL